MVEEKIVNLIFERKPFTAIELTTSLYKDDSQYEHVLKKIKYISTEISEFYDNSEIEITVIDPKTNDKQAHIQTIYYPWEYNYQKYKMNFVFNPKFLEVEPPQYFTTDFEEEDIQEKKQKPTKHGAIKTYYIEPIQIEKKPEKIFEIDSVFEKQIQHIEKIKQIEDNQTAIFQEKQKETYPNIQDEVKINVSILTLDNTLTTTNLDESITKIEMNQTSVFESIKDSKNSSLTKEISNNGFSIKEDFIEQRLRHNIPFNENEKIENEKKLLKSFRTKRASYKKDVIMIRSQVLSLNLDCSFSMKILNGKIILTESSFGVIHSDKRGLKINKSHLDLANISDDVFIEIYTDRTVIYKTLN